MAEKKPKRVNMVSKNACLLSDDDIELKIDYKKIKSIIGYKGYLNLYKVVLEFYFCEDFETIVFNFTNEQDALKFCQCILRNAKKLQRKNIHF